MNSAENTPSPCETGCGFYGSPATNNLCSKCYNGILKLKEEGRLRSLHNINEKLLQTTTTTTATTTLAASSSNTINNKKNRCESCKRKVGLTGFNCRCGGTFCGLHRYPEEHACAFDFKTLGRVELAKENPLCKGDKLGERI